MPVETLSQMPAEFTAGDTLKVRFVNAEHPATEWELTLAFKGPEQFTKDADADGSDFVVTVPSEDTKDKEPGLYAWAAYVEKDGERVTIERGQVRMTANLASETETYAVRCLGLLEAHIEGRLPRGLESHTINGNQIAKMSMEDARKLREYFRAEVARENAAASGNNRGGVILQRFGR